MMLSSQSTTTATLSFRIVIPDLDPMTYGHVERLTYIAAISPHPLSPVISTQLSNPETASDEEGHLFLCRLARMVGVEGGGGEGVVEVGDGGIGEGRRLGRGG